MLLPIIQQIILLLLLPAYFVYTLAKGTEQDKFSWLIKTVAGGAVLSFLTVAGHWEWFSYYLRFVPLPIFAGVAAIAYWRIRHKPVLAPGHRMRTLGTGLQIVEVLFVIGLAVFTLRGYVLPDEPVHLAFPLQNGSYQIANGGSSLLVNRHYPVRSQRFALDIVELDAVGMRAQGLYPRDVTRYVIYGEPVYSPCDGTVTEAVERRPTMHPPKRDTEHIDGNHVIIECRGVTLLLAHLQPNSVTVDAGQDVTRGQRLGRVGNTGNTTEPHLHIHAVDRGTGDVLHGAPVPIVFDGIFPVRNMVFDQ